MAENRYYWLKLHDDFFDSKRIKKLRRMAGGDTYTIIYLKMQLLAMKKNGILKYDGLEPDFASEIALDIDEEVDDVKVTVAYLLSCGLAETSDNVTFFFPYAVTNTGSELSSAQRKRVQRAREHLLVCDNVTQKCDNVTQMSRTCHEPVTHLSQKCHGEKEIEKEIDIEIENRGRSSVSESPDSDDCDDCDDDNRKVVTAIGGLGKGVVRLSDEQMDKLIETLGIDAFNHYLSRLSDFILSSGATVHNHYKTIMRWAEEDGETT